MPRKIDNIFLTQEAQMGTAIRSLRRMRGWSQAEMAGRLTAIGWPTGQVTVSKVEAGKTSIRLADIYALAVACEVPAAAFFYFPIAGEPGVIRHARERLERARQAADAAEQALVSSARDYAVALSVQERLLIEVNENAVDLKRKKA